jgi:hypothetical protein
VLPEEMLTRRETAFALYRDMGQRRSFAALECDLMCSQPPRSPCQAAETRAFLKADNWLATSEMPMLQLQPHFLLNHCKSFKIRPGSTPIRCHPHRNPIPLGPLVPKRFAQSSGMKATTFIIEAASRASFLVVPISNAGNMRARLVFGGLSRGVTSRDPTAPSRNTTWT